MLSILYSNINLERILKYGGKLNYLSKPTYFWWVNFYRKYNFLELFENSTWCSICTVWKIINFKDKYLTCHVTQLKNKNCYIVQWFIICSAWIFRNPQLKRIQNAALELTNQHSINYEITILVDFLLPTKCKT